MQAPLLKQAPGLYAFFKPNITTLSTLICSLALLASSHAMAVPSNEKETDEAKPVYKKGIINYYPLNPPFTVNINNHGKTQYMQIGVHLKTEDKEVIEALNTYITPVRHELVMLFSHCDIDEVRGEGAQQRLRKKALEKVRMVLSKYAGIEKSEGKKGVQDLYFTDYVIDLN